MAQQAQLQEVARGTRLRVVSAAPPVRIESLEERARELRRPVIRAD